MANVKDIKSKEIKITLNDGVERIIKFDLNALAELEDRYGSVDKAFEELDKNSIKALRCILWVGLLHTDESLTEQQVGRMIDISCMKRIVGTLGEALDSDMPDKASSSVDPN